ncbi:alpha/beta hydrolase fold family protein [Sphingomonas sp. S17]|uniref:Alpha/beta hydrolase n=2 Tax=Sphingomonas paucimobilis TaxID=13689 RepID=A0A411LI78_SPHPI|nr:MULTISPECIES: alpha/beta hydrolase [Sphingomonas]EGI53679.1 alpha/beta hydrolase fold family protein [Sphingomonas sp. S17]MBQ1479571.1 alpha/beta hydrolase [Sphingomonas sp.]MCM3678141.1 alpha/beta hydrolase [Sphingomonas paucimobilis]MDG5972777.1 alpha/beta hydrolase [Sphingomonas paucimobilis]NNG59308.1 alpha/beta hydrolase [Sphingomonas paucimobilis]
MTDALALRRNFPAAARLSRWTAPDGWDHRRFDWVAERPVGRLLFQTGRADVIEKYLEVFAHLVGRRWSVTAFDWRGQGGSGRLSADHHVGHGGDFAVLVDDLRAFWSAWRAEAAGPAVLLGHSMGGHLALRAVVEGAVEPDALILVAPMLGLRLPLGAWLGGAIVRCMAGTCATRGIWRAREEAGMHTRQRNLTHDVSRYEDEAYWYAQQPDLALGPPSWGWVAAALRSIRTLANDTRLDRMRVPTLMLLAEADRLVDPRATAQIAARIGARLVRFGPEAAHELLREVDPVRLRALSAIDAFLDGVAR